MMIYRATLGFMLSCCRDFKRKASILLFAVTGCWSAAAQAEIQLQGYFSLASDYVYRGISFAGGRLSPQLGFSAVDERGVYASVWLARDDISALFNNSRSLDLEIEYQLGYQFDLASDWSLGLSYAWLEYYTRHQPRNHDYQESRLNITYQDRLNGFLSHANDIWTASLDATTVAFSYRWVGPYQILFEPELGAVYFDSSSQDGEDTLLSFLRLSFAKRLTNDWLLSLDYHYSEANKDDVLASDRIGSRWVLGARYHFSF